jgi:hypothetical protein
MELPKVPIKPTTQNPKRVVIFSQPKMGKTTFASQLENNLIIDLEQGSDYVTALKVQANSLAELNDIGKAIHEAGKPYKFITVDTCTKLEEWCEMEATETYMNSPMGKSFNRTPDGKTLPQAKWDSVLTLPNGAGYLWLRESYKKWIGKLATLAPHIIIIAHIKDKFLERKGKEFTAKDLDLTGKIKSITAANADAIGYMYRDKDSKLRISFVSSDEVLCGSRVEHLKGTDIEADWKLIFLD